jgi:amino acid transporter
MFGRSSSPTRDESADGSHAATTRSSDPVTDPVTDPVAAQEARRDKFGGLNSGAAFFGWLVAVAVSILLTSIIGAVAAAVGSNAQLTQSQANRQAGSIGLAAAIVLLVVLMVGYYSGGYVAGRMSRFNGPRQGLGVWLIGLLITIVVAVLGAVFGQKYNLFDRVSLPRLPVSVDALTTGGVIAAVIVLAGTLLAALAGGSVGTHYHRRVDRAGYR